MCGHHRADMGILDGGHERRQVYFPKLSFGQIHRGGVKSAEWLASGDEMLRAGDHMSLVEVPVPALKSPDGIFPHLRDEEGILSESLAHPAPAGVPGDIQIRGESPVQALLAHFQGCFSADFLSQIRVKSGGQVDTGRVYGAALDQSVAVDGVDSDEKRYSQAALFSEFL